MKIGQKHKITFEAADKLIEKYYEGLTNAEEENILHSFLSHQHLPAKYKPEQAIFGYFENKKQKPIYSINKIISWSVAAAALIILALNVGYFNMSTNSNYAYVDGVKITNKQELKSIAFTSLSELSNDNDIVENCLNNLNNSEMEAQLEIFTILEK